MSTLRKRLCVALCVIACACMAVVGVTFANSQKASAEAYSTSPVMVDGASIRLDAQKNGIRFATFLPADMIDGMTEEDWADIEMGTLFIPKAVLDANDKVATDLVLDATFGGISPAVAVFDGNTDNFVTDPAFEGGYLVNAVLELTSFTNVEQALNGEIVARSYFKDLTGVNETAYLAPVTRAPAFVAAEALDDGDDDPDNILPDYVEHVTISGLETSYEKEPGGTIDLSTATTNVSGNALNITFTCSTGSIDGTTYTAGSTSDTIVASIGAGAKTLEISVTVGAPATIANNYVVDLQATGGAIPLVLNGALSGDVAYASKTATVSEGNIVASTDMITGSAVSFTYNTATTAYTSSITINPITDNYYNVDADTAGAGYTIATSAEATNVKFNGAAAGEGITVTASGISFTKALLSANKGHNKVEYTIGDTYYIVSVCPVTDTQLWSAITFEQDNTRRLPGENTGAMSPFICVVGGTAQTISSMGVCGNNYIYSATRSGFVKDNGDGTYAYNNDEGKNNRALLEITVGAQSKTQIYISTTYFVARRAKVAEANAAGVAPTNASWYDAKCSGVCVIGSDETRLQWQTYIQGSSTNYAGEYSANRTNGSIAAKASEVGSANWNRSLFKTIDDESNTCDIYSSVYNSSTNENIVDYFYMNFNNTTNAAKTLYVDEICNAGNTTYNIPARMPLSTIYK